MPTFVEQAAALPVFEGRICMVTSRKRQRWVIPKGRIELDQSAQAAAQQEAWEEAGITGNLEEPPLGQYFYFKEGRFHRVTVYWLDVITIHDTWPETQRDREWLSIGDAIERIVESELRDIVFRAYQERYSNENPLTPNVGE